MPFTFHGLRHTAITHWAVAGRDAKWLLLVAGHSDEAMTMRYLDKAAVVRGQFGTPHPVLPPELVKRLLADVHPSAEVPAEFHNVKEILQRERSGEPAAERQKGQIREGSDPNSHDHLGDPSGNRTRVTDVRGRCPNR